MIAYFDTFSGASGDMILGALIDAGLPFERLRDALAGLAVGGYVLSAAKVRRRGFAATKFDVVIAPGTPMPERHLADVLAILDASPLPAAPRENAKRIFRRLAEAEARAHGTTPDRIHFHEVGAVDAIVDIAGACVALDLLGVSRVLCSPVAAGSGTVKAAHGVMPVPAPATADLLRGVPLRDSPETGELTTPTGAAILSTLAAGFGPAPAMTVQAIGYGAGFREGVHGPNILRVMLGEEAKPPAGTADKPMGTPPAATAPAGAGPDSEPEPYGPEADTATVLEANLDDVPAEVIGYACDRLFAAGALDVWTVPIQMKKGRPGVMISALASAERVADVEAVLFAETTTFGVRRYTVRRSKLARGFVTAATPWGPVKVKVGSRGGKVLSRSPEYEDCRRLAESAGVPLRDVYAAAMRALPERANGE